MENANRDALAQERHTEHCTMAAFLLSFEHGVFRIGKNIDDMNRFALEAAGQRAPPRCHWQSFDVFTEAGGESMPRHEMVVRTPLTSDRGRIRLTESSS